MTNPADLMRMMRKRAMLPATDYEVEGDDGFIIGVSRDEGEAPDLGGAMEVARKPLVAQSTRGTVSGDDNDERGRGAGILDELSQGIDVEERATLNDSRASADAQDRRNRSDRQSNIFLQSAGLAPLTKQDDPYVSERDKMRDWVMKRGGVAQNSEKSALNAERTKAYLDSIQAARERDLAAQKARAEADGRKDDARKFDEALKEERAKLERERFEWQKDRDAKKGAPKAKGGGSGGGDGKRVLPPSMVAEFSGYDSATGALDRLLESFDKKGMDSTAARASGMASSVGISNTDAGQYLDEMRSAMQGVGLILEGGKLAAGDEVKYAKLLPQPGDSKERAREKVSNLKKMLTDKRTKAYRDLDAAGYRTPQAAAPAPAAVPDGVVTVRRKKDGATKVLSRAQAAKVLADPNYEEVR